MRLALAITLSVFLSGAAWAQDYPPTPPPAAQLPQGASPSDLLPALIEHSRRTARIENGRLTGDGAVFLRALGGQSQFVLIGEEHGNAGIAEFATAYWRDLSEEGYAYHAIETDPWIAERLERALRAGGVEAWTRYLQENGDVATAPFMTWAAEADLAAAAVASSGARRTPTLWGLDQTFIGASNLFLRDIAANARDPEARRIATVLAEQARGNLSWLGTSSPQQLADLRARLNGRRDARYAELVDAMIVSQRIYQPFTGAGGEAYLANLERETLMKRLFLENYRAAERADGAPPRVMFKFGASHMYRGASQTHVPGLGGFVSEFAVQNGTSALSLYVACGPGGRTASLQGPAGTCDDGFAQRFGYLAPYISADEITVIDLRPWRMRPGRWAHLPAQAQQLIDSFDVLVVVPNGAPSEFLAGLSMPSLPPS